VNTFFFILGRNPALSRAEIYSRLSLESIQFRHVFSSDQFCLLDLDGPFEPATFLRKLGGTIKIGALVTSVNRHQLQQKLVSPDLLGQLLIFTERVVFGLSYYSTRPIFTALQLRQIGLSLKKTLAQDGRSARWVQSRQNPLSSVIVDKNKLIEKGGEIVLLETQPETLALGKTLAVQEYAEYSERDYGRPERSMRQGMLPPKLARLMINLAQCPLSAALLDPFCGSGTILQEARLLDYTRLTGTDNNPKAIADSRENLAWLERQYRLQPAELLLRALDVRSLDQLFPAASIDAVITEPFLGPAHLPPESRELDRAFEQIQALYQAAFISIQRVVKPGGRVVIVFPRWKTGRGWLQLPATIIPKALQRVVYPSWVSIQPFVYQRSDQRVVREIFVFQKNKTG